MRAGWHTGCMFEYQCRWLLKESQKKYENEKKKIRENNFNFTLIHFKTKITTQCEKKRIGSLLKPAENGWQ